MTLSQIMHLYLPCSRMHTLHVNVDIHVSYVFWCDHHLTALSLLLILMIFILLYLQLRGRPCNSPNTSGQCKPRHCMPHAGPDIAKPHHSPRAVLKGPSAGTLATATCDQWLMILACLPWARLSLA